MGPTATAEPDLHRPRAPWFFKSILNETSRKVHTILRHWNDPRCCATAARSANSGGLKPSRWSTCFAKNSTRASSASKHRHRARAHPTSRCAKKPGRHSAHSGTSSRRERSGTGLGGQRATIALHDQTKASPRYGANSRVKLSPDPTSSPVRRSITTWEGARLRSTSSIETSSPALQGSHAHECRR